MVFDTFTRNDWVELVIAIVLGYSLLIFTMWMFRKKNEQEKPEKSKQD